MHSRSVVDALEPIRRNIALAFDFTRGLNLADFEANDLVFYGVTRCLEIISEASRRLPPETKDRHPHIAWNEIAGAGNVYRHDYEDVEQLLVWGTVVERLPSLLSVVDAELRRGEPRP